ncbi:unnamed protein product [Angiostrongylus costaricensis]|uniref:MMS19 nucleotide excision repair protein n=1 Tax=Angiostrongylus costaricensis TaxID=334426 RepID=A0A0R3Q180_ANGCS|nr:unnamed protein product [Angiostrongylus costaricensis]
MRRDESVVDFNNLVKLTFGDTAVYDPENRLVAIRYLHDTLPSNIQSVFHILPKAIEDSDDEVRKLMVEMCSTLLTTKEYAADTAVELQEWIEVLSRYVLANEVPTGVKGNYRVKFPIGVVLLFLDSIGCDYEHPHRNNLGPSTPMERALKKAKAPKR